MGRLTEPVDDDVVRRERWFSTLVRSSSDLIGVLDEKANVKYLNPAAARLLGVDEDVPICGSLLELVHPDDFEVTAKAFSHATRRPGKSPTAVFRLRTGTGDWRVVEAMSTNCLDDPAVAGMVVNARDVTDQTNLTRALRTLGRANQALIHSTDEPALLTGTCETIVAAGYHLAWVGFVEHDANRTVRPVASAGRSDALDGVHISWADNEHGNGAVGMAIRTRTEQVLADVRSSAGFGPWKAPAERFGLRTVCAFPLEVEGEIIGALAIYAAEPGAFDAPEIALLRELASDLAYGIGRIRDAGRLGRSLDATIRSLAAAVELRDPYTAGHQRRVAELAAAIAEHMGEPAERVRGISIAATVHDVGKIAIPAEILTRPGEVTPVELELIKTHPQYGFDILAGIDFPWPVARMVKQHHERMNGSGYPDGLRGEEILLGARIIAVADVVEAMSTHRPYRPALGVRAALREITRGAGVRYDRNAVDCCVALFRDGFKF